MALKVNSFSQVLAASSSLLQASRDYAKALRKYEASNGGNTGGYQRRQ